MSLPPRLLPSPIYDMYVSPIGGSGTIKLIKLIVKFGEWRLTIDDYPYSTLPLVGSPHMEMLAWVTDEWLKGFDATPLFETLRKTWPTISGARFRLEPGSESQAPGVISPLADRLKELKINY